MPSCLITSRCTSATVTLSMTWSRPCTVMPFTTLRPSSTSREAMSKAVCASIGLATCAGQHDALAQALDPDVGVRQRLPDRGAQPVEVARHRDVEADDLLAVVVEEEHVGLADRGADDVGAPRRADHRIGDLRIGDQHVLDVARQVDHHRLADAERNETRAGVARRHLDRPAGRGSAARARGRWREPERDDQGHQQCGADQRRFAHVRSPRLSLLFRRRRSW